MSPFHTTLKKQEKQRLKKNEQAIILPRWRHLGGVLYDYSACAAPGVSRLNGKFH
jgi:hypothetical protein